jgi:hypothetical protein
MESMSLASSDTSAGTMVEKCASAVGGEPLRLRNIRAGKHAKGWRRWYKEFRVYSWQAQFLMPESLDSDRSEGEFYGVNIRDLAPIILQAEAEKFRDEMADGRCGALPNWYRSKSGRDHAIVRRTGAHLRDVSTFVNDFLILNAKIVDELYVAIVLEPHKTYFE